ncbi:siderophore ABC transporter substrate-binding protein [Cytobacillus firmus]|uniref:siderophore ABC transporter substrate-binding protein n=1 Tax=Cytobacillus firmus TaxID=1399 RepID=UPI00077C56E4|nr:siderophore ABC transporter substrate-binding protein [Cytobacillus firmus]MBG9541618.1 ferrichrome ABC transporter substrate-binding protein [Cytobacillus firmus]MBG9549306.1 ferrichrome ABC transporter substrate-binding protein [Cytobacillus firmus]MBG9553242.1 ferrichrome ABC transporter substrate-binding protein [Cytobacillus firmus]MBG9556009.1 ferrichrome ABC transporter substrate-binding protein [Cytobacillus firmus]MBG9575041.1 ferrichrome ABC transporter substrate-binding protein [
MKKIFYALLAAMVLLLAACGSAEEASKEESADKAEAGQSEETNASGTEEGSSAYPMTVSPTVASVEGNEGGTTSFEDVEFEKMPERIAVFDYGFLDTLDALGVKGIVGVAKDSTLPAHLEKYASDEYESVGGLKEPLLEDIAEMDPDVIFISGRQSAFYEELKEIAPVVFVGTSDADYWNTFQSSVDLAAKMFDKEAEAEKYTAKYDSALEEIKALAGNYESTLVTMYNEGKLSGFSTNSRFGYIYDIYGFKPVTEDIESSSHGSNFGFEAILEFNPQVLFVIDRTAAVGGDSNIEADMENDIVKKTDAYQNKKIVYLDGPLWYLSGGGLQSELAKIEEVLAELK